MNSRLSSFLRCSCYASLRWMQHQQWLVLPFRVDQGPVLRAACSRSAPVIDCQHHVRKVDDLLVGLELRARCASFAHSRQVGAGGQHIEVSLPQIGRPFCRLLLMGRVANEHQVMVGRCPQTVDDLSGVQSTRNCDTPFWRSTMICCASSIFILPQDSSSSSKPHGKLIGCCPMMAQRIGLSIPSPALFVVY